MSELKPCPFCGSENIRVSENCPNDPAFSHTIIMCINCKATTNRLLDTKEKAMSWWNNRRVSSELVME